MKQARLSYVHAVVLQITVHAVAVSPKVVDIELLALDKHWCNGS